MNSGRNSEDPDSSKDINHSEVPRNAVPVENLDSKSDVSAEQSQSGSVGPDKQSSEGTSNQNVSNQATNVKENSGIVFGGPGTIIFQNDKDSNERGNSRSVSFDVNDILEEMTRMGESHLVLSDNCIPELLHNRFGLVSSPSEQYLIEAGHSLHRALVRSGYTCKQLNIDNSDEKAASIPPVRRFVESGNGNPLVIFFHIRNHLLDGFAKDCLGEGLISRRMQMEVQKCIFVFLVYPSFISNFSKQSFFDSTEIFHWKINAIDEFLGRHCSDVAKGERKELIEKLRYQQGLRLWPTDESEFFSEIYRDVQKSGLAYLRSKILVKNEECSFRQSNEFASYESLLQDGCCKYILFTAVFFSGMSSRSFRKIIKLLIEGRLYRKKKSEEIDCLLFYDTNADDIWMKCKVATFENESGQGVVDLKESVVREFLRPSIQSMPMCYENFEKLYDSHILFDPSLSEKNVQQLCEFFAAMFAFYSEDRKGGWLSDLIDFSNLLQDELLKASINEVTAQAHDPNNHIGIAHDWLKDALNDAMFKNRSISFFLLSRVSELCRAVIRKSGDGEIKKTLGRLIEKGFGKVSLDISKRLRYEDGFDLFDSYSQVIHRGDCKARHSALREIISVAGESEDGFINMCRYFRKSEVGTPPEKPMDFYSSALICLLVYRSMHLLESESDSIFGTLCSASNSFYDDFIYGYTNSSLIDGLTYVLNDEVEVLRGTRPKGGNEIIFSVIAESLFSISLREAKQSPFYSAVKKISETWKPGIRSTIKRDLSSFYRDYRSRIERLCVKDRQKERLKLENVSHLGSLFT